MTFKAGPAAGLLLDDAAHDRAHDAGSASSGSRAFSRALGARRRWRALTVLGLGLGSLNTAYSVTFSNHPPSATAAARSACSLVWRWRRFDAGLVDARRRRLARRRRRDRRSRRRVLPAVPLRSTWPGRARRAPRARRSTLALAAAVPLVALRALRLRAHRAARCRCRCSRGSSSIPARTSRSASGNLPGSSLAHASLGDLLAYAWLCFFGKRGLFSHTPIMLFLVGAMLRIACDRAHPRRAEIALVLAPTFVLVPYYLLTSDRPRRQQLRRSLVLPLHAALLRLPRRRVRSSCGAEPRAPRVLGRLRRSPSRWRSSARSIPGSTRRPTAPATRG